MKKNAKIRIIVSTEKLNEIKKLAFESDMSMSAYCLSKINSSSEFQKLESLLFELNKKLSYFIDGKKQSL